MKQSNDYKVLVIGPTLIDIYFVGEATRLDQHAPVAVVESNIQLLSVGGAANAAVSLARLGIPTAFVTALGGYDVGAQAKKILEESGLRICACTVSEYRQPTKTRVYAGQQLVARCDTNFAEVQVQDHIRDTFARAAIGNSKHPAAILIVDYGNAVITETVLQVILKHAVENGIPVVAAPDNKRMRYYRGCDTIILTERQACQYTGDADPNYAASKIYHELRPKHLLLSQRELFVLYGPEIEGKCFPVPPSTMRDTCGCHDAVAAIVAAGVAKGAAIEDIAKHGAAAYAAAAELLGAVPINSDDVKRKLAYYQALDAAKEQTDDAGTSGTADQHT